MLFEDYFKQKGEFQNLDLTLNRIDGALKTVGFEEKNLGKIIHFAGTNGKGSASYFLAQLLNKAGHTTGLFTSPHILDITERIKFDFNNIKKSVFENIFNKYLSVIDKFGLSYFETVTFICFLYFSDLKPDFSIIETGMGGKFDSTNVLNEKIPVITNISFDHENYLGKNIYLIIKEKIAIVKNNKKLFLGYNKEFIEKFIENELSKMEIVKVNKDDFMNLNVDFPEIFKQNLALSIKIFKHLTGKEPDLSNLKLPECRNDKVGRILFVGAHNAGGLLELAKLIDEKNTVICSFTSDRNVKKFLNILLKRTKNIYLTEIPDNDRSIKIEDFYNTNVKLVKEPVEALYKAVENNPENDIIVTGSLYLCGFIKKYISDNNLVF